MKSISKAVRSQLEEIENIRDKLMNDNVEKNIGKNIENFIPRNTRSNLPPTPDASVFVVPFGDAGRNKNANLNENAEINAILNPNAYKSPNEIRSNLQTILNNLNSTVTSFKLEEKKFFLEDNLRNNSMFNDTSSTNTNNKNFNSLISLGDDEITANDLVLNAKKKINELLCGREEINAKIAIIFSESNNRSMLLYNEYLEKINTAVSDINHIHKKRRL